MAQKLGEMLIGGGLLTEEQLKIALDEQKKTGFRLGQVLTLMVCVLVFLLGLLNDYLFGRFAHTHTVAKVCYMVTPNLQLFWPADALTQGHPFTPGYVGLVSGYTVLYTGSLLALAVALFQQREVG